MSLQEVPPSYESICALPAQQMIPITIQPVLMPQMLVNPNSPLTKVNLRWDERKGHKIDVDLAIVVYDNVGRMDSICCFNQTRIFGGAISHSGDRRDGSEKGIDESAEIDFRQIPPTVYVILIVATISSENSSLSHFENFNLNVNDTGKDFLKNNEQKARSFVPFAFVRNSPVTFQMIDVAHSSKKRGLENIWTMCDEVVEKLVDPVLWRERPQAHYDSLKLKKGQHIILDDKYLHGEQRHSIKVGLGWDAGKGKGYDVDAWCYQMRPSTSRPGALKIYERIYWDHLTSKDGSIVHCGDNRTGKGEGDDETIQIDLDKVSSKVTALIIVVQIYDETDKIKFKNIKGEYVRICNGKGHEIIRYSLDADKSFNECDAGVFCILRRLGHSWRVEPMCIAASTEDFDTKLLDLIAEKN